MMSAYSSNIVIDLEFTPAPRGRGINGLDCEVIEIGAVRVLPDGAITDEFSLRVLPSFGPRVSGTVRRLTGIAGHDLVGCPSFGEALAALSAWIGQERVRMVAWSPSDSTQIFQECAAKGIEVPANMRCWLDLQRVYPRVMRVGIKHGRMALSKAAGWYGAPMDGKRAHSAIYDACVTAQLLQDLLTGGYQEQRKALDAVMPKDGAASCSSSIASRCAGLAELYAQMQAAAC